MIAIDQVGQDPGAPRASGAARPPPGADGGASGERRLGRSADPIPGGMAGARTAVTHSPKGTRFAMFAQDCPAEEPVGFTRSVTQ